MNGKVVVVLRTSSVARVPLYQRLRSLGVRLLLVHPYIPPPTFEGLFHHWLQCDTVDVEEVFLALTGFVAAHGLTPDAVVSFDEYAVYQAAVLAVRFHLHPTPLPPAALQQNNLKDAFRSFCAKHGVASPKSIRLELTEQLPSPFEMRSYSGDAEALSDAFRRLRPALEASLATALRDASLKFPVVLKPSPGAGSLMVRLCGSLGDAAEHVWQMWETLANHPDTKYFAALANGGAARSSDGSDIRLAVAVSILMEEYIEGYEVDVDCVVEHGVIRFCAISDNFSPTYPYFAEVGGLCPSSLDVCAQRSLRDLLETYVAAHDAALHGVLHFEAKYDPSRSHAYVIEVNCRPGSAETHTMLSTVFRQFNLGEALVRCALQLPIQEQLACLYPELLGDARYLQPAALSPPPSGTDEPSPTGNGRALESGSPVQGSEAVWSLLGGPSRGFFPPQCWAASVNLYPSSAGTLRKVRVPVADPSLVAFSVSAAPDDFVAPPPTRFFLLSWMVARGDTAAEVKANIKRASEAFVQEVAPIGEDGVKG